MPLRKRDLGHVEHRRLFTEAKQKIGSLLDYADPPGGSEPEGDPADPAGVGGAGPLH